MTTMHDRVPEAYDDAVYLYATRIAHDVGAGRWEVHVDPENCLVALDDGVNDRFDVDLPTIGELREEPVERRVEGDREVREGRLLMGAGVQPVVDGDFVCIFRDADAPAAPLRWTAADGRVDATPERTAFEEFHEELLVFRDGTPVYVDVSGAPDLRDRYAETLRENGHEVPDPLPTLEGRIPDRFRAQFETVRTRFGEETYETELWVNGHPQGIDTRSVVEFSGEDLTFEDGEFDRCVERFPPDVATDLPSGAFVPGVWILLEAIA